MNGPVEVLFCDRLPTEILRRAWKDLHAGGPELRQYAFGVERKRPGGEDARTRQERIRYDIPHFAPPRRVYLDARLTLRTQYRGLATPLPETIVKMGAAQIEAWMRDRRQRL